MKWLEMTSQELEKSVKDCKGVCVVPMGCSEAHGNHMPLGTDLINIEGMVSRAAQKEPVVEFPAYLFTQIHCAKHMPGTIATGASVMWDMLESICSEISRNGFKKIVFVNGHGGNNNLLSYFSQMRLERRYDYVLYSYKNGQYPVDFTDPEWQKMRQARNISHGGEEETSIMMYIRPELVKMQHIQKKVRQRLERFSHLKDISTGVSWYAANPDHYQGDAELSSKEKGKFLINKAASRLAKAFQIIKKDKVAPEVLREFYGMAGL